jgi:hypothetical protein
MSFTEIFSGVIETAAVAGHVWMPVMPGRTEREQKDVPL